MRTFLSRIALLIICGTASMLPACGGGDDAPPPVNQVGPAGGTVAGPNGAQVFLPAGALSAPVLITIMPAAVRPLPPGMQALGTTFDLGPSGTRFAVPVTVTLPLNPAQVPAGAQVRMLHELHVAGSDAWETLPGLAVGTRSVSAQTGSLSHTVLTQGSSPPSITVQPTAVAVNAPGGASFNVGFTGTPAFTVQWERSDDGGTTWANAAPSQSVNSAPGGSTLTLGATSAAAASAGGDDGALFRASIHNPDTLMLPPLPPVLSNAITLMVSAIVVAPTITTQPQSVNGAVGNVTFRVVATGTNLVYQWHKNGNAIAGATNASLSLVNVQAADAGSYSVVVSNFVNGAAINSVTSNAASLTVTTTVTGLTGTWTSNYQCTGSGGNFNGQDTLTVTQNGASVSFTSSDGGSFTGTLSGNSMSYSGTGPGYTETGTWTLQAGGNSFAKTSNYVNTAGGTGGSCPGAGQRQGAPFTLLVIVTGNGHVSDGAGGINLCRPASGDCTQAYPSGTQVTLSATENAPGVVFNGWGGACFDIPSPFAARVIMDSSKTCTASFSP
jgi:Immunoglobulin domain